MADEKQALGKDSGRTEPCNWRWNAEKVSWSPPFHPKLPRAELKKEVVSRRWAEKNKKKNRKERQAGNKRQPMLNENFLFFRIYQRPVLTWKARV